MYVKEEECVCVREREGGSVCVCEGREGGSV